MKQPAHITHSNKTVLYCQYCGKAKDFAALLPIEHDELELQVDKFIFTHSTYKPWTRKHNETKTL